MRVLSRAILSALLIAVLGPGCDSDSSPPDLAVAAIQFLSMDYAQVGNCGTLDDPTCAISHLVKEAARNGAKLVVTPDYAGYPDLADYMDSIPAEPAPAVGDNPTVDSRWPPDSRLKKMAQLAKDEAITVVAMAITTEGTPRVAHHTTLAFDPRGEVIARHDRYMLVSAEAALLEPGDTLEHSFFDTSAGTVGLMSSAEAQCVVHKGAVGPECTAGASAIYQEFFGLKKPDVVAFVSLWVGGFGSELWKALNVQKAIALKNVWVIAANGTITPDGHGGGVWKPDGTELEVVQTETPTIVYATLPAKGAPLPKVDVPKDAGPDGPTQGTERGPCYPNSTCNGHLVCLSGVCVAIDDGGASDVLSEPCSPATCSGCCQHGSCVEQINELACGLNGIPCQTCPIGQPCSLTTGECESVSPCGSSTCAGCCDNGICVPYASQSSTRCGASGATCDSCGPTESCNFGSCQACSASNCTSGCCGVDGCVLNGPINNSACGIGGATCVACALNETCHLGQCLDDETLCSLTCEKGCCVGGICKPYAYQDNSSCGTHGEVCGACPPGATCSRQFGLCLVPTYCTNCVGADSCCNGTTCDTGNVAGFCGSNGTSCELCDEATTPCVFDAFMDRYICQR